MSFGDCEGKGGTDYTLSLLSLHHLGNDGWWKEFTLLPHIHSPLLEGMGYDKGGEGDGDIFSPFPLTLLHGFGGHVIRKEKKLAPYPWLMSSGEGEGISRIKLAQILPFPPASDELGREKLRFIPS